jgi:hypothetical protein
MLDVTFEQLEASSQTTEGVDLGDREVVTMGDVAMESSPPDPIPDERQSMGMKPVLLPKVKKPKAPRKALFQFDPEPSGGWDRDGRHRKKKTGRCSICGLPQQYRSFDAHLATAHRERGDGQEKPAGGTTPSLPHPRDIRACFGPPEQRERTAETRP